MPWVGMLGDTQQRLVRRVRDACGTILLRLYDLPVGVEVGLHGLVVNGSSHLGLADDTERVLLRVVAAVFLDPLVALGIVTVDPPAPELPARVRLDPIAHRSIGSALLTGGHELEATGHPGPSSRPQDPHRHRGDGLGSPAGSRTSRVRPGD